jgi:hypothetical protein
MLTGETGNARFVGVRGYCQLNGTVLPFILLLKTYVYNVCNGESKAESLAVSKV